MISEYVKNIIETSNEMDTLELMETLARHLERNGFEHLIDQVSEVTDSSQEKINEAEEKVERWEGRAEEATGLLDQLKQILA
jgi:hypothetical protein